MEVFQQAMASLQEEIDYLKEICSLLEAKSQQKNTELNTVLEKVNPSLATAFVLPGDVDLHIQYEFLSDLVSIHCALPNSFDDFSVVLRRQFLEVTL